MTNTVHFEPTAVKVRRERAEVVVAAAHTLLKTMRRGPDGNWQTVDEDAFLAFIRALNACP